MFVFNQFSFYMSIFARADNMVALKNAARVNSFIIS